MFDYVAIESHAGVIPLEPDYQLNNENTIVEEIVVVGERVQRVTRLDPNPTIGDGDVVFSKWNGTTWTPFDPIDKDILDLAFAIGSQAQPVTKPSVTIGEILNPANYAAALNAALLIQQEVDEIHEKIVNLDPFSVIHLDNNNVIIGAELQNLWSNFDYKVTDKTFGPGAGGAVDVVNGISNVNYTTILNPANNTGYYASAYEVGVTYYVLHELAHFTPEGQASRQSLYASYSALNPGDPNGNNFNTHYYGVQDEIFTNNIYQDIANNLGELTWSTPPHGY